MQQKTLKIELINWQKLPEVPSASGLAKFKEYFYVIGDDSPYLFQLDKNFKLFKKTLIHSADKIQGHTIPKFHKPDFEAMELVNDNELLIFGSGSKSPERDICVKVNIEETIHYKAFDISLFYDHLRNLEIMNGFELDIEALACDDTHLYLFNRGRNLIFSFRHQEFMRYCDTGTNFPIPQIQSYRLPTINGLEAGFSGATLSSDKKFLIFTAAVEDAPNAYDDGDILGSFIGIIRIQDQRISDDFVINEIPNPGFPLKVESVIVDYAHSSEDMDLVLVTDNDGAASEIIKLNLKLYNRE